MSSLPYTSRNVFRSTVFLKAVMGVSGLVLLGFVLVHMLGNLQVFAGPEAINGYARLLHERLGEGLWLLRIVVIAAVVAHIASAYALTMRNLGARTSRYAVVRRQRATYASRTMIWSGPIVLAYIVYHLLHFTLGAVHTDQVASIEQHDVYSAVVLSFQTAPVAIAYIVANLLLGVHLWHGAWSMFQSLGWSHPRWDPWRRSFATVFALVVTLGFISVPLGVLTGVIH